VKNKSAKCDVESLLSIGTSFQIGYILFESIKMKLFDALQGKTISTGALSRNLHVSEASLIRVMRVLYTAGILEKSGCRFKNTALSKKYLCTDGEKYIGDFLLHSESLHEPWSQLKKSIRTNKMMPPGKKKISSYPSRLKKFLRAMHAAGVIKSEYIKDKFHFHKYSEMLDVGGGMGTYAVSFVRENKDLHATVFDLPPVVSHAKSYIKKSLLESRIKVHAGECLTDLFPRGPFDLVFLSNLLHIYDTQDCKKIILKAAKVLKKNGTLLIHDYIFGSGDAVAVSLFDITMLIGTPQGKCPEKKDLQKFMRAAGITRTRSEDIKGGTSIVWGKKAA